MTGLQTTTEVYRVLRDTPVVFVRGADRRHEDDHDDRGPPPDPQHERHPLRRRRGGEGGDIGQPRPRHRGGEEKHGGDETAGAVGATDDTSSFVLQPGDLVEVWRDIDGSEAATTDPLDQGEDSSGGVPFASRRRRSRRNGANFWYARLTNGLGYATLSDGNVEAVGVRRHPLTALYVDNYPTGQCALRQPIDRPEFRHSTSCRQGTCGGPTSATIDAGRQPPRRRLGRHHYVPGQLVFSYESVQQGRTTFYRIQHAPLSSSSSPWNAPNSSSTVWLADSRPRSSSEEDPHDDVTLLLPHDQVNVDGGPFAYQCLRTVELRNRPDVGQLSRSGRYLLRGDVCVASLVRNSPFTYGNGPFGLLRLLGSPMGLWCFERIRNGPPLLVPLEVERGDFLMKVRSHASLPVFRQPARQAPHTALALSLSSSPDSTTSPHKEDGDDGTGAVDATGSDEAVRILERNETIRCDARFESPSTGAWFYRVVVGGGAQTPFHDRGDQGWVPDRAASGRTLLVPVHDDASLEQDLEDEEGDWEGENLGDDVPPWSMDFVRGVAAIAGSSSGATATLREVSAEEDRQRMIFLQGGAMVHVFLATRTVEVEDAASHRAVQVRHCTPHQLSQILQNPVEALDSSAAQHDANDAAARDLHVSHEDEMKIRRALVDCEAELESILVKRSELFEKLRPMENWRRSEAVARLGMDPIDEPIDAPNPLPPSAPPDFVTTSSRSSLATEPEESSVIETSATQLQALTVVETSMVPATRRSTVTWEDEGEARREAATQTPDDRPASLVVELPPSSFVSETSENGARENGSLDVNSSRKRSDSPETTKELLLRRAFHEQQQEEVDDDDDDDGDGDGDGDEYDRFKDEMDNLSSCDGTALSSVGEQLNRTCGVCHRTFETARLRSVHCLKDHGKFSCNYCPQVFDYVSLLHRHRDHENHW